MINMKQAMEAHEKAMDILNDIIDSLTINKQLELQEHMATMMGFIGGLWEDTSDPHNLPESREIMIVKVHYPNTGKTAITLGSYLYEYGLILKTGTGEDRFPWKLTNGDFEGKYSKEQDEFFVIQGYIPFDKLNGDFQS